MAKISGKWTFNDVLTLVGNMWWVDYLGGGTECYAITIGTEPPTIKNLSLWYEAKNTSIGRIQAYMEGPGWLGNIYKTIDFGDAEQTVDDSFYEWLTANATKVLTFADKLTIITENVPKVYDAGKTAGHTAGYAEGEAKGYTDGKADGYTEGINKGGYADGYDAGKKAEYDAFWDGFTNHGQRTDYRYAFLEWSGAEYIRPNRKIIPTDLTSANQLFSRCYKLKKVEAQYFDFSQKPMGTQFGEGFYYTFSQCQSLEEVEDIGMQADINNTYLFSGCRKLHTVAMLRANESTTYNSSFANCDELRNIRFDGVIGQDVDFKWSKKLSTESIRSIISHLSDTASGKTLTLSQTAVETAIANGGFGGDAVFATYDGSTANEYGMNGHFIPDCPIQLAEGERLKITLDVEDGHHYTDQFGQGNSDGWYVGLSEWHGEPTYRELIIPYSEYTNGIAYVSIYITTTKSASFKFKVRAVKIDADGNEIDGENLYFVPDGSYSVGNIYGTTYTLTSESWETLVASKPNWTISLQ